jgi:hypothetical protein
MWDPGPRPPRRTASWIALVSVVCGGIVAAVGADRFLGARYAARADFCSTVDLGPVGSALGQPNLTAVADTGPDAEEPGTGRPQLRCQFTLSRPNGAPRALGAVTATWYDHAVVGQISYETQREQATGTGLQQRGTLTDLTGLGDLAFTYHDDTAQPVRFRVAALDSNLVLDLQIAVTAADPDWRSGRPDPAFTALTEAIRASLPRLR